MMPARRDGHDQLDLDQGPGGEGGHGHGAAGRPVIAHEPGVDLVHGGEVLHRAGQEHGGLHDVGPAGPDVAEHAGEVGADLAGLVGGVTGHQGAGGRVERDLPGQEDEVTGADGRAVGAGDGRGARGGNGDGGHRHLGSGVTRGSGQGPGSCQPWGSSTIASASGGPQVPGA
jgi:hypothetical protein